MRKRAGRPALFSFGFRLDARNVILYHVPMDRLVKARALGASLLVNVAGSLLLVHPAFAGLHLTRGGYVSGNGASRLSIVASGPPGSTTKLFRTDDPCLAEAFRWRSSAIRRTQACFPEAAPPPRQGWRTD
jgi:hypothetical protein